MAACAVADHPIASMPSSFSRKGGYRPLPMASAFAGNFWIPAFAGMTVGDPEYRPGVTGRMGMAGWVGMGVDSRFRGNDVGVDARLL